MNKDTVKFVSELSKELDKQFDKEMEDKLEGLTTKEIFMSGVQAVTLAVAITAMVRELQEL